MVGSDVRAFFGIYPDAVRDVAIELREMVVATLPKVEETIDTSAKMVAYGYGSGYADLVCTIIPSQTGVKLGLAFSASLSDPHGLLEGAGKVHRHIKFKTAADVKRPGAVQLLKAAFERQKSRLT